MRHARLRTGRTLRLGLTATCGSQSELATASVESRRPESFTEFSAGITAGSSPNAITPGPDGNLWFSEAVGNRIARIGSGVDVLVRAPAVYGAGRVGERALCDEGAWKASLDIGSYGIQWTRDGVDLAGATTGVYTPLAGDDGHQLGCRVAARPASVLALYSAQSGAIAVGAEAVGPAGAAGGAGAQGAAGTRRPTARPAPAERAVRRARRAPPARRAHAAPRRRPARPRRSCTRG